ncbi:hypothetical protein Rahaq_4957 (plasmid) [Rahnella aceris]|uniref:Bacteriophage protein n=1 Tax=Rahnella sp. (strain Y9602) TaxID=2703885 RepID=A0A0H3FGZ4_RAHSY|nr:hypothetical protein [Rahnella aceris]ADW76532.1 hypothetical protein Rahaq_4957 [Rahnella aceris]
MIIEARITGNDIIEGITELSEKGNVIGYLVEPNKRQDSTSIVSPDGKTLGEYCCTGHALKAAFIHAHDLKVDQAEESATKYSVADLLLASLLSSLARH